MPLAGLAREASPNQLGATPLGTLTLMGVPPVGLARRAYPNQLLYAQCGESVRPRH